MANLTIHDNVIDYADGGEQQLLDIVGDSRYDEELTHNDFPEWNVYYHLTPARKSLVSWIDFGPGPTSILELGAGCGALTAQFASLPGSRVVVVEGSAARARVIEKRCRKYPGVDIHVCNLNTFECTERFDVVTLIGVMEYAGKYGAGADPFCDALRRARGFLKENGTLILAIENKVGHKYLAGIPEDHYGTPYEGVNDYPDYAGIRTFDQAQLRGMLQACGMPHMDFWYPFPDYKLPTMVLSDQAFRTPGFDPLSLLDLPTFDRASRRRTTFREYEFLRSMHNLGCAQQFMNSFLVFASPSPCARLPVQDKGLLAVHMTALRAPAYRTVLRFSKGPGGIQTIKRPAMPDAPAPAARHLRHEPAQDSMPYVAGARTLEQLLIESFIRRDFAESRRVIGRWTDELMRRTAPARRGDVTTFSELCVKSIGRRIYKHTEDAPWINGEFIDLIPRNLLETAPDAPLVIVDREWRLDMRVPVQLVFDRAAYHLRLDIAKNQQYIQGPIGDIIPFPAAAIKDIESDGLAAASDPQSCLAFEAWFHSQVIIGEENPKLFSEMGPSPVSGVSVVIAAGENADAAMRTVLSMESALPCEFPAEVIVAGGGPDIRIVEAAARERPWLRTVACETSARIGAARNAGAAAAVHSHLLFLEAGTRVLPRLLEDLAAGFAIEGAVVTGGRIVSPQFTVRSTGILFGAEGLPSPAAAGSHFAGVETQGIREFAAVGGACMMAGRDAFLTAGGFDGEFASPFSEADLCLRLRLQGGRIIYIADAIVVNDGPSQNGGAFALAAADPAGTARFRGRWDARLAAADGTEAEILRTGRVLRAEPNETELAGGLNKRMSEILTDISQHIERQDLAKAYQLYTTNRELLRGAPEFESIGRVMEKARVILEKTGGGSAKRRNINGKENNTNV